MSGRGARVGRSSTVLLVGSLLAAACVTTPAPPPTRAAGAVSPAASTGVLSGKINVDIASLDDSPGRNTTAGFELEGDAVTGRLDLTAPTGSILARAVWSPGTVVLKADGKDRRYPDLASLTADMLGESLPVAALFDWLRGRPWPNATSSATLPPAGPGFEQLGWHVDLSRYGVGNVVAHRAGAPVVTVRVKLEAP